MFDPREKSLVAKMAYRSEEGSSHLREAFSFQVFLSFRGEDIRKKFIDHLHDALKRAGISTFHDDSALERGSDIQSKLYEAIQGSKISVVTFSSQYATSRWCLDELVKIMDCKRLFGHLVLPVFYDVDPSVVRHQSGPYKNAFENHVENPELGLNRVESWKAAMRAVADLAGFVLQNQADGHEAKFINIIIKEVMRILDRGQLSVPRCIVGTDYVVKRINCWLHNGSPEVEVGVIYGLGGVGKTTIAKVIYNSNYDKFDASSFIADIGRASCQENGNICILKQIISNMSGNDPREIYNVHEGILKIKEVIGSRRTLLVLDDCSEGEQICTIFDHPEWFCPGSKILITSRNVKLPINHMRKSDFEVCRLNSYEATKLFCWNAFGQCNPLENYSNVTERFVRYCGGLPLALEVLSSSLCRKGLGIWESQLAKLENYPNKKIHDILKLSFDCMEDDNDRDIFLHIVFFMVGMHKDYACAILDSCDLYPEIGIQNLVDRCLLTINLSGILTMHQLVQEMGREVVRQEAYNKPERHSRLLSHKDTCSVLRNNKGTSAVKGLRYHFPEPSLLISSEEQCIERTSKRTCFSCLIPTHSPSVSWKLRPIKTDAFTNMVNLNLLELRHVELVGAYEEFPKALKWLSWHGCPLESIPYDLDLFELVVLDMQNSCLKHAWDGSKYLGALKILNLSHSHRLVDTPDFTWATGIEMISLEDCISLVELHESVGSLTNLTNLNLKGCRKLKKFPKNIKKMVCLEKLNLSDCRGIFTSSDDEESSESRESVEFTHCQALASQSTSPFVGFKSFSSLVDLNLSNCGISQDNILSYLSCSSSLKRLDLSGNPLRVINKHLISLPKLNTLYVSDCKRLESVSLPRDCGIYASGCVSLEIISFLPPRLFGGFEFYLDARDCPKLVEVGDVCKLESISDLSASKARYLGFSGLESFGDKNTSIDFASNVPRLPKGVYRHGIYSTFLFGDHIANWFSTITYGVEQVYTVPLLPHHPVRGINVCYVFRGPFDSINFNNLVTCLRMTNFDRNGDYMWEWFYKSDNYTKSNKSAEEEEEVLMTWISHWCIMKHREVRPGDELKINPTCILIDNNWSMPHKGLIDKYFVKCGIEIVYDDSHKETQVSDIGAVVEWYNQTFRSVDLSLLNKRDQDGRRYASDFILYFQVH